MIPFSLDIEFSEKDVFEVAKYLQNRRVLFRYSWFFIPALAALIILLVLRSMSYSTDQTKFWSFAVVCLVPAFVLCIAILFSKRYVDPWFINRRIWRLQETVPRFGQTVTHNLTGEYVESATSLGSSKSMWQSFTHTRETENSFLFWAGELFIFFIPKRSMRDEQTDWLRHTITKQAFDSLVLISE